jgi:hypothetical protein
MQTSPGTQTSGCLCSTVSVTGLTSTTGGGSVLSEVCESADPVDVGSPEDFEASSALDAVGTLWYGCASVGDDCVSGRVSELEASAGRGAWMTS